jgi:hypothetical protein
MTSPAPLLDSLDKLCSLAERGGADPVWLRATADGIFEVLLAAQRNKRHQRTLAVAHQMAHVATAMRQQGHSPGECVGALRRRYGKSRSRVYALLAMSNVLHSAGRLRR